MLKKRFGFAGQMTLSYDMTFLVMMLTSLYEPVDNRENKRCIVHPMKKQCCISNEYTEYVADMTVLLSYYKCQDDWQDEKKLWKKIYGDILRSKSKKQRELYKQKEQAVAENLKLLSEAEQRRETDLDVQVIKPRAFLIMGLTSQLTNKKMQDDFRILRNSLKNVEIITYDEFLDRLRTLKNRTS